MDYYGLEDVSHAGCFADRLLPVRSIQARAEVRAGSRDAAVRESGQLDFSLNQAGEVSRLYPNHTHPDQHWRR